MTIHAIQVASTSAAAATPVSCTWSGADACPSPKGIVVFYEGDVLSEESQQQLGAELASPASHLATVIAAYPQHMVVGVQASVVNDGAACYLNFVQQATATGEPLGFKPAGYKAQDHSGPAVSRHTHAPVWASLPLVLLGFSKGAVVLNQLLYEMAHIEEVRTASQPALSSAHHPSIQPQETSFISAVPAHSPSTHPFPIAVAAQAPMPTQTVLPPHTHMDMDMGHASASAAGGRSSASGGGASAAATYSGSSGGGAITAGAGAGGQEGIVGNGSIFVASCVLDAVHEVHFLDAGLACRGVHVTDPRVVDWLGKRHQRKPLRCLLHGTTRQWGDRKRPWILQEKDRFMAMLQSACVPCMERWHFLEEGAKTKSSSEHMRMHFRVLQGALHA